MSLKEKFHFAKLSLFNIRLMSDFQNNENEVVKNIIKSRATNDNIGLPINLLHQGSFLCHAYITFVWLWEAIKQAKVEGIILNDIKKRFNFSSEIETLKKGNDRVLVEPYDFFRLIRNSISHGNVEVKEVYFYFHDTNPSNKNDFGTIRMNWETLGKLSDMILFSVNEEVFFK